MRLIFCFAVINDPLLDKIIPKYLYSVFISISFKPKEKIKSFQFPSYLIVDTKHTIFVQISFNSIGCHGNQNV